METVWIAHEKSIEEHGQGRFGVTPVGKVEQVTEISLRWLRKIADVPASSTQISMM